MKTKAFRRIIHAQDTIDDYCMGNNGGDEDVIFLWYHTVWTFEPSQYYTYSKTEIESIGKSKPKTEVKWDQINPTVY